MKTVILLIVIFSSIFAAFASPPSWTPAYRFHSMRSCRTKRWFHFVKSNSKCGSKYTPKPESVRPKGLPTKNWPAYNVWLKKLHEEQDEVCGNPVTDIKFDKETKYGFSDAPEKAWPWMVSLYRMPNFIAQVFDWWPEEYEEMAKSLQAQMFDMSMYSGMVESHSCGGTLISSEYVLTAAHCVQFKPFLKKVATDGGILRWTPALRMMTLRDKFFYACELVSPKRKLWCEKQWFLKQYNEYGDDFYKFEKMVWEGLSQNKSENWQLYIGTHVTPTPTPSTSTSSDFVMTRKVEDIIFYKGSEVPDFLRKNSYSGDIALLQLAPEHKISSFTEVMRPICLTDQKDFKSNVRCAVSGWGVITGADGQGELPSRLQHAKYHLLSQRACIKATKDYKIFTTVSKKFDTNLQICAMEERNAIKRTPENTKTKVCLGDSGGPLICQMKDKRWYQIGIISFGEYRDECEVANSPDVFTFVPEFVAWIYEVMWNNTRTDQHSVQLIG